MKLIQIVVLAPWPLMVATAPAQTLDATRASALCTSLYGATYEVASGEPLAACQWNMSVVGANDDARWRATGRGVRVGVLDTGIDPDHPDIAANLDLAASCSFIFDHDPVALPVEMGNGDCANKAAVIDQSGHGTAVASIVAAPLNGIGIAGVAPEATIVAIKVCSSQFCFADSVAAGLRHAGDLGLDIVNMSLFADPFLYFCGNDAEQRAMLHDLQDAARYAQQRGVLLVAAATNELHDLAHPSFDHVSPNWPPDEAVDRVVRNNCRVAPAELPGVIAVSATGPVGVPGYTMNIASYANVGMGVIDVAAPGGDYFWATGTVQDAVLTAWSSRDDGTFDFLAGLPFPGLSMIDGGARYVEVTGSSFAAPHAAGVAALIKQLHPGWGPGAIAAALGRTASPLACPTDWSPLFPGDLREKCYGKSGRTSFFGQGIVDAGEATRGDRR
jgi:subtilisin family serine protease